MLRTKIALHLGLVALAGGLFAACSDSTISAPEEQTAIVSTDDAFTKMLLQVDAFPTELDATIGELEAAQGPEFNHGPRKPGRPGDDSTEHDTLRGPKDRGPRPDSGRPDSLRPGGGDKRPPMGARNKPTPAEQKLHRILSQLGLTEEQAVAIRECFAAHHECAKAATESYRTALEALRSDLNQARRDLKAKVEAGEITQEEARASYKALIDGFRAQGEELRAAHGTAMRACEAELIDCIKSNLTAEQTTKFDRLLAAGPDGGRG